MYAEFFGLAKDPFSIAPDPHYLFMSEQHREALAHLVYGLSGGGGFVVLTGEIGAGKTTVCRCFLEQIPRRCNVAYIFNPKQTVEELMKSVCDEFRIPYQHAGAGAPTVKDYVDALNEFLLRTHAVGQSSVLIIDEAQNLSADVLEQLRLLTNLETSQRKLLQIVLIGQPELRTMLAQPRMEQLAQRVIARFHLNALSRADTYRYIDHRLTIAGRRGELPFTRAALKRIHAISRGVPRRINLLCDRSLLGAYARRKTMVDRGIVEKAAQEVFVAAGAAPPTPLRVGRAIGIGLAAGAALLLAVALIDPELRVLIPGLGRAADATPALKRADSPAAKTAPASPAPAAPVTMSAADLAARASASDRDEPAAWRALAALWKLPATTGDPCADKATAVQCFKANISLALVRRLNRPGILALYDSVGQPFYALLTGLSDDTASLRLTDGKTVEVSIASLATAWRGEYATLWRPPPGYDAPLIEAGSGAADWLAARLVPLTGTDAARRPPLRSMVAHFQAAQGLKVDGLAGPLTLMQVNRASGVDEPILSASAAEGEAHVLHP